MAAPPTRRSLGKVLGRSVSVAATSITRSIERAGPRVSPATRSISADGNTITISALVTPGVGLPGAGVTAEIPGGPWIAHITAQGDYDDIFAAAANVAGGPWGAWVAHRPSGTGLAAGSALIGEIAGPRTATLAAMVTGSVGDDVAVSLTLTRGGG